MRTLAPQDGFTGLKQEMDRLFDRFWDEGGREFPALGEWKPALDLKETKDQIVVTAEVPGIDPKEIRIEVRDDVLSLDGEKRAEKEDKDERFYRMERTFGAFSRTVKLPAPVDPAKGNATFRNGVIVITMPKALAAKQTTIPLKIE